MFTCIIVFRPSHTVWAFLKSTIGAIPEDLEGPGHVLREVLSSPHRLKYRMCETPQVDGFTKETVERKLVRILCSCDDVACLEDLHDFEEGCT